MLSEHFRSRKPSAIRIAGIRFAERNDGTEAVNVAIGNVSLPMHPAMIERMSRLAAPESPFHAGVVRYTPTVGLAGAANAQSSSCPCPSRRESIPAADGDATSCRLQ